METAVGVSTMYFFVSVLVYIWIHYDEMYGQIFLTLREKWKRITLWLPLLILIFARFVFNLPDIIRTEKRERIRKKSDMHLLRCRLEGLREKQVHARMAADNEDKDLARKIAALEAKIEPVEKTGYRSIRSV